MILSSIEEHEGEGERRTKPKWEPRLSSDRAILSPSGATCSTVTTPTRFASDPVSFSSDVVLPCCPIIEDSSVSWSCGEMP